MPSGLPAVPSILYDYTLSADAASLDTATDGPMAGTLSPSFRLLELWMVARTDEAVTQSPTRMRVNGDAGANYDRVYVSGDGTSATTVKQIAQTSWTPAAIAGNNSQAGYFSVQRMTFPSYASSAHNKTGECVHAHPGGAGVGDTFVAPQTLGWRSTDAISRFTITPVTAGVKFKAGTRVMIYGR